MYAAARVLELLKTKDPRLRLRQVWDELPRIQHCRETERDPSGTRRFMVCGKTFQASVAIGHVIPILEKFYDDFGRRARLAAVNSGIDWKAVSHAFRAALQTREILTTRTLKFPLHDAPFLTRVKQGRLDYPTEAAPALEALMEEVEQLLDQSALPEQVSGPLTFENALNKP